MAGYRILLHIRASGGGGAERVFAILANGFAARGHDVTLAVDYLVDTQALDPRIRLVDLGPSHVKGVLRLAGLIRAGGFDVLASGVAVSNVKLALARLIALSRAPLVLSYHGFREYRTGRISAMAYYGMPVLKLLAQRFICVSNALTKALIDEWGAPLERTIRIYNPVPLPDDPPSPEEIASRRLSIGAVGRLSHEKGMDVLIDAFARLRTPGVELIIGGDGPERQRLESRISELGLGDRVRLLGAVDGPAAVFSRVRVAAVPSRTEAFGMTTVEALAHGLPVVATRCDGPAEILEDGRYGMLVAPEDATALAAALDKALTLPGNAELGYWRASQFASGIGIDRWEAALAQVISEGRR